MLEELRACLGIDYELVSCMPRSRKARAANPMGKIPSLQYGKDHVMYESAAINTFLGDLFRADLEAVGHAPFVPCATRQPLQRARYHMLTHFLMAEQDAGSLWLHRKHADLAQYFGAEPRVVEKARLWFLETLRVVEDELGGNQFCWEMCFEGVISC